MDKSKQMFGITSCHNKPSKSVFYVEKSNYYIIIINIVKFLGVL